MASQKTEQEKLAKLCEIVSACHSAFMVTRSTSSGALHGRPMATAKADGNCSTLWFATNRNSPKIDELRSDSHVFLGYTNASGSEWASIIGQASVVDDRAKIRELYSSFWNNWFEGPDDPNITLIRLIPESGEYWDSGNKVIAMAKYAIGAVTGKNMESEDDNQKVKMAGSGSSGR